MRILVVGAGAVGGYFGRRLAEAERDVTFLVHPSRAAEIERNGLQIISTFGNVTVRPKTIPAENLQQNYDLVFLSVKSYSLMAALNDLHPAIGSSTMILPTLNGMRHLEQLANRFGKHAVLGGVCLVVSEVDPEGRIVQSGPVRELSYGELDGSVTDRILVVDEQLKNPGFTNHLSKQIVPDMWQKWVQLASLGAATCLLRGNIGQIASVENGTQLCSAILDECAACASAAGFSPDVAFLQEHRRAITEVGSSLTSSMYRDLNRGVRVEVDTILGDLIDHGKAHGIRMPLLEAAYVQLSIYQSKIDRTVRR